MRSCFIESRSRRVTVWSSAVCPSIVMQKGVPCLVLPAIAPPDRALLIVKHGHVLLSVIVKRRGDRSGMPSFFTSGKIAAFTGASRG